MTDILFCLGVAHLVDEVGDEGPRLQLVQHVALLHLRQQGEHNNQVLQA